MSPATDKVLSYGDVLLRRADVESLTGPHWLNDQIISFYFEWLKQEGQPCADVLLLPGATTFLLLNGGEEDAAQQARALQVADTALILFAVNDNPFVDAAGGGSHWTLLAYSRADQTFRHYDSASSAANEAAAREIAAKLSPVLGKEFSFESPSVPRQANGHDCGMHVLAIAGVLCEGMRVRGTISDADTQAMLQSRSQPAAVAKLREELLSMFM